jgi:hypothetical protein
MATWKKVIVSGSSAELTSLTASLAISSSNINVGVPSSNAWQTSLNGSYFNNFTTATNVSEILRFVAGLLSASAPDAAPNTKTLSSISKTSANNGTGTIAGYVPQGFSAADVTYIVGKGFASTGTLLYTGLTVYNNSAYANTYTSVAAGSTSVSSSVDAQLFGLGTIIDGSTPNTFFVSGTINWAYEAASTGGVTATSQSQNLLSLSSFTTANGLTVGKIPTANAAVIPAAYQDGKFASIFSSGLYTGSLSVTSVSSSGYYHISASIKIASGSAPVYNTANTSVERFFWAPTAAINSGLPTQTITVTNKTSGSLTATSGSLSGAPYLRTATWYVGSQINGLFNPLYVANTTIASITEADALVTLTAATNSGSSATINSSAQVSSANTVFDSTGTTRRATSTVPFETDIALLSGSLSFSAGVAGATNIQALFASGLSTSTFTVTSTGLNRSGASTTDAQVFSYHDAGAYGQPASSGSIAYFGFPTNTTETATSDTFKDEANRITLNDNILSFTGTAFVSSSTLPTKELQVKPGYLVASGGSRRYWYPSGYGDTYQYYVRKFQRTTSIATFTINLGQTLVAWNDTTTTNGVSVAIVFESAVNGQNGLTVTRLFDPYYTTGLITAGITANTAGTNPFGSAIDYYGIRTGAVSGTTYTVEVSNPNAVYMNGSSYDQFYVIIRYKGEPTTAVTTLSVS